MGAITCFFSAVAADDTKALARALRRRDPEVLDGLIEQYQYRLFRYLLYLSGDREIAEDLFQETWIRVLDRGHQYDSKSRFDAWLFAIARNLVIDLHRRKKPRSLDALTDADQKSPVDLALANAPSALDLITNREIEMSVQESLARLPAIHREVLVLRFQEDMTLEEIATVLGATVSTVKSRLYRGLQALRELLERGNG
jgi:RNA polymerase sigma-70 factor, ECF subfamily